MKFKVVAVGKIKEKYLTDGIAEYAKRMSRFVDFSVVEIAECPPSGGSASDILISKEQEGKAILQKLDGFVIALAVDGTQYSSPDFAAYIRKKTVDGISDFCFVIGGSDGLSEQVLARANLKLSFGKATYPHQLMRLVLSEQLYRTVAILNNLPYHK